MLDVSHRNLPSLAGQVLPLSGGGSLAWWTAGTGRPVLLLNGGPGSPSLYMHPLMRRLALRQQMFIFDQPGTGGSKVQELSAETIGIPAIIAAAEALRCHLQIENWHLLGHSFGTMVAAQYAAEHPDRVQSLVLSGPGGPDTSFFAYFRDNVRTRLSADERSRFNALLQLSKEGRISAAEESELDDLFMIASTFNQDLLQDHEEQTDARINRKTSEVAWAAMQEGNWDIKHLLPLVKCPTIIFAGRQDYIGEAAPMTLAWLIPGAQISWFNQCGHKPWFEHPERFDQELEQFYRSQEVVGSDLGCRA